MARKRWGFKPSFASCPLLIPAYTPPLCVAKNQHADPCPVCQYAI